MKDERTLIESDPPGWQRRAVREAQVSIAVNPKWPALEQPHLFYQTFGRDNGALSLQWGEEATMEWYLAHTGLGSAGHRRLIDDDRLVKLGGLTARRVRLRVVSSVRGPA